MRRNGGGRAFALTLPVAVSAIEDARLALLAYLQPFGLDERVLNRVEVVLEEIVSNIVRHAQGARSISIDAECADGAIRLRVQDDGAPFNPLEVSEPAPFTSLEDVELGGQGIPLIKRLSKSVGYDRIGPANRISVAIGGA